MARRKQKRHRIVDGASPFRLRVGRSPIHRFGVFALQPILAHRKVIEYTGEQISTRKWRKRNRRRRSTGRRGRVYYFRLNRYWGIDGAVGGSGAELINHRCDPNLKARKIRNRILYFSRRTICSGEELTVDYHFRWRARRAPCHCGSPKCRGTINLQRPKRGTGRQLRSRRP
jgi:SET domain-containing protein